MFFKRVVDLKNDKVKFDFSPKTNEDFFSVTYVCIRFLDSYRFVSDSLDKLVKNLVVDDFNIFITELPHKWQFF